MSPALTALFTPGTAPPAGSIPPTLALLSAVTCSLPHSSRDYASSPEVQVQPGLQAATLQQTQEPLHITTGSAAQRPLKTVSCHYELLGHEQASPHHRSGKSQKALTESSTPVTEKHLLFTPFRNVC